MATYTESEYSYSFENIKSFPPVIDGKINVMNFVEASSDLVCLVENLGKVFAPVKYDMQGNINKIKKNGYNDNSCLLQLMLDEVTSGKQMVTEGVLWLNRALLFFELAFQEILLCLQTGSQDNINMKKIFTVAYEGSVKKYHNWITQQLFVVICKMSPTFPQIMKSFHVVDIQSFEKKLTSFNIKLHIVRCKIDDFFKDNNVI